MKVAVLGIGQIAPELLTAAQQGLARVLPDTACSVVGDAFAVPEHAYDRKRSQYISTLILDDLDSYGEGLLSFDRVLGVVDVDVYATGLNYVFGEAYAPGRAGLISLWRLHPEFYGEAANASVLSVRIVKEAVHEVGHTLGLSHCSRSYCVMHFSNSVFEVDKKQSLFCDRCYLNASAAILNMG
ncbi:MAG: archaemetzincin family Zn-dependent metalloprotease [Candidatus Bathyarchaeia archaeon]|jgi:archaemetzincin